MTLSIIIVNYNVKYYLGQCLTSVLRAVEGIDHEIIVVDNHSHDGSVAYLVDNFPMVKCISSTHNLGFARANNLAIRQSMGEYVLLLNPDTVVGESVIHKSLAFMANHPHGGALGVRMLNSDGTKAMESRRGLPSPMVAFYKMMGFCKRYPEHPRFGHYYMGGMPWDEPGKVEVVSGAFCLLRRSALNRIGLLDETFFMYGEDIDLSYRLLKGGFENWYLPVSILHYKGESTQRSSFKYVHVFYDAMLIFFRKHYAGMSAFLSIPIKTAIYLKALGSLFAMLYNKTVKSLGFFRPSKNMMANYIFLGRTDFLEKTKKMALNRGLSAQFVEGDDVELPNGHHDFSYLFSSDKPNYIMYDVHAYSFEEILELFHKKPIDNVYIGTFDKHSGKFITSQEVFTYG